MGIGKVNKVKVDLRSYPPYMFLAEPKFGKTGFWNDLVVKAWGDASQGLLLAFEKGYLSYDGMQVVDINKFSGSSESEDEMSFVEVVDYIVENPDEYKGVCIDTLDAMIDCATKEVLRLHKKEIGTTCKSLLDAFKGYGRGKARLLDICNEQIERLRDAGVAVFFLCHTKKRTLSDLMTGVEYDQITNNLTSDIYNNFANNAQMIMVGVKDRDISEGKIVGEKRTVYLRGNSYVDAGCRFDNVPDTINGDREYLVNEFLTAFENAVKDSAKGKIDIEKAKKEEDKERKEKAVKSVKNKIDEEKNLELIAKIKDEFISIEDADKKDEFKKLMKENGVTTLKDDVASEIATKTLEELLSFFL